MELYPIEVPILPRLYPQIYRRFPALIRQPYPTDSLLVARESLVTLQDREKESERVGSFQQFQTDDDEEEEVNNKLK